jgi:hypothetical protein
VPTTIAVANRAAKAAAALWANLLYMGDFLSCGDRIGVVA